MSESVNRGLPDPAEPQPLYQSFNMERSRALNLDSTLYLKSS